MIKKPHQNEWVWTTLANLFINLCYNSEKKNEFHLFVEPKSRLMATRKICDSISNRKKKDTNKYHLIPEKNKKNSLQLDGEPKPKPKKNCFPIEWIYFNARWRIIPQIGCHPKAIKMKIKFAIQSDPILVNMIQLCPSGSKTFRFMGCTFFSVYF